MIDIRPKKVKAIYFNAFHCPECGLELHQDNVVLTTYPAQYCYYCDCGFRTTSFQQPGFEYEFEDEDLPSAYPERIKETFIDKLNEIPLQTFTTADMMVESVYTVQDAFADAMGYSYV